MGRAVAWPTGPKTPCPKGSPSSVRDDPRFSRPPAPLIEPDQRESFGQVRRQVRFDACYGMREDIMVQHNQPTGGPPSDVLASIERPARVLSGFAPMVMRVRYTGSASRGWSVTITMNKK